MCIHNIWGFPGGSEVKASAWNAGDLGSIPGSGRSPGEGTGNLSSDSACSCGLFGKPYSSGLLNILFIFIDLVTNN